MDEHGYPELRCQSCRGKSGHVVAVVLVKGASGPRMRCAKHLIQTLEWGRETGQDLVVRRISEPRV